MFNHERHEKHESSEMVPPVTDKKSGKNLEGEFGIWLKAGVRVRRLKFPTERPVGHYHCISRVVDRRFIFEEAEKEKFTKLMRECEAFCQVTVLTFCVMSNHYHILLEIPKRPEMLPTAEELLDLLDRLGFNEDYTRTKTLLNLFRESKTKLLRKSCSKVSFGKCGM